MKDRQISTIIRREEARLASTIDLVPSENYPSKDVLSVLSSVFIGEYAEGTPGRRYYEGRENIDDLEGLVVERAKKLFHAEHANVQPYSGAIANLAVYSALLQPGDTIMGLDLTHGGHLSHGWKVTLSGKVYRPVQYFLNEQTERLDYEAILKLAQKEKPKIIVAGFSGYPGKVDFKTFSTIAHEVGAYLLADISHIAALVIGGVHPHPFPYADVVMTTTHKSLRGPRGAIIMCKEALAKDIDRAVFPGLQGGPHEHTIAGIGVALQEAMQPAFKVYAKRIVSNAKVLASQLNNSGFKLISGGTENHLMLIDVTPKNITGAEAASALLAAGINVNRNTIPFEKRTPFDPSGIRLGTPAVTTRGMKEKEMKKIAAWIDSVLQDVHNTKNIAKIRKEVAALCKRFPIPALK